MSSKQYCNEDSFDDSDSDDLNKLLSSSSSYDRSSIGSIPWAEDAVKQNQSEWEHIERMFYGEADLPQEIDLRNEILEWRQAFPHLRINGKKLNISKQNNKTIFNQIQLFENFEEILIAHPLNTLSKQNSTSGNFKRNELNNDNVLNKNHQSLISNLGENLRISSVPVILRSRTLSSKNLNNVQEKEDTKLTEITRKVNELFIRPQSRYLLPHSQYSNQDNESPFSVRRSSSSTDSSDSLRMPMITSGNRMNISQNDYFTHRSSVLNHSSLLKKSNSGKSTIILPLIDSFKILPSEKNCRSISAAISYRKPLLSDYSMLNSASKLKSSK